VCGLDSTQTACTRTRFLASNLQFVSSEWCSTRNLYPSYSNSCIKSVPYIIDRIPHNQASTQTKSNLRFYQKLTASPIHFHSAHCSSLEDDRSAFCCRPCESHKWTIGAIQRPWLYYNCVCVLCVCNELGLYRQQ